jgi:hypothetical protein
MTTNYIRCIPDAVQNRVRWDVPARCQGQTIEVAYAQANTRARSVAETVSVGDRVIL